MNIPSCRFVRRIASTAALVLVAGAAVVHADTLRLRPVAPPATAVRRGAKPSAASPARHRPGLTADEQRGLSLRLARQHDAFALQKIMLAPDKLIDRSRYASRRADWRMPAGVHRDANGRYVTATNAAFTGPPDTVRMAFLRVDFLKDRGGSASTGDGHFDLSGPDTTAVPIDRPPHNRDFYQSHARALERYYDVQSFGRVVMQIDVYPTEQDSAYHLSDMADLGPWAFGNSVYRSAVDMFREMFFAADSQSTAHGERIPWQKYDRFTVIHAGGDLQSDVRQDSKEDIPSFTVFLGDTDMVIFPDSAAWNRQRPIDRASFVPESINQDGYYGALNGVIAHENGHNCFGFLDVYNIESGFPICGYWTLMDSGNLLGSRVLLKDSTEIFAIGLLPPSVDPFQRNFIGDGMDIRVPTWGDTLKLVGNERSNVFYKLPLSSDEYVLLENRYQSPADLVQLDADSVTKVVLGPKQPDRFEYDALEPGSGILAWHVDESVIPFDRSLRVNPDFGMNTNFSRQGLQILEADGLDDLGDTGSPFLLGSPLDPYQKSINASLSDTTTPNLRPNTGSRPHLRVDFLDDAADTMHFSANRTWNLPAFPVIAPFPPGGPQLLAIDADGDRNLEICWAGGDTTRTRAWAIADTAALFAVRANGQGLSRSAFAFAHLDRRPLPVLAAALVGDPDLGVGPAIFAATTEWYGVSDTTGGKVWLVDHHGVPQPGWPVRLAAPATTPPVIAGTGAGLRVFVGAADGRIYAIDAAGRSDVALSGGLPSLGAAIRGRLAFWQGPPVLPAAATRAGAGVSDTSWVAAGTADGQIAVYRYDGLLHLQDGWPKRVPTRSELDFLWLRMGGEGANAEGNCAGDWPTLVAHAADRVWAYCPLGAELPGWGASFGDTIVAGLGAGDPDGDGFPEVLVQTQHSKVAFLNRDGRPTPGWPRASTTESLPTSTPALALDVDGDHRAEIVTMNGSGLLAALRSAGLTPDGWPLATGAGAAGSLIAADLDRDGRLDLVAPDRDTTLYAYSLPVLASDAVASSWTMLGGDPGRTSSLPASRTSIAAAASPGPLVAGSLKAFPNPAKRKPVSFGYTLSEDARVEYRFLDASGHEVASFTRQGTRSDNVDVWDPGSVPAGLYMARIKFSGARGSVVKIVPVGVLR